MILESDSVYRQDLEVDFDSQVLMADTAVAAHTALVVDSVDDLVANKGYHEVAVNMDYMVLVLVDSTAVG